MSNIDFSLTPDAKRMLDQLTKRTEDAGQVFAEAVREIGLEASEQVARNLSGITVSHDGQHFVVNVQTGNLRRSTRIDWPLRGNPLAVGIFNNAEYAEAIQQGSKGEARKQALLASRKAKTSKAGGRYVFVPAGPGPAQGFTVTEDSTLADIAPRPFMDAAFEQMQLRASELLADALKHAMEVK